MHPGERKVTIVLTKPVIDRIDELRGDKSRPAWISTQLRNMLLEGNRQRVEVHGRDWPGLPAPLPVEPGTDLRTLRKGRFVTGQTLDIQARLRILHALRLYQQGMRWPEIAKELGYSSGATVMTAVTAVLRDQFKTEAADYAQVFMAKHIESLERLEGMALKPNIKTDVRGGLVSDPDGHFMVDHNSAVAVETEIRKTLESLRRLWGTDEPKRTEHMITTDKELNSRIEATLAALTDAARARAGMPAIEAVIDAEVLSDSDLEDEVPGAELPVKTAESVDDEGDQDQDDDPDHH